MTGNHIVLGQARGTTSFLSVYSPAIGFRSMIHSVMVANTAGIDADFSICIHATGTTYDESTAIAWNVPLNDGEYLYIEINMPISNNEGNLAVSSAANLGHTFTVIGEEFTV